MYSYFINNLKKKFAINNSELHHVNGIIHSLYLVLERNKRYINPNVYAIIQDTIKNYNDLTVDVEIDSKYVSEHSFNNNNNILRSILYQFNYNINRRYRKIKHINDVYIKLSNITENEYFRVVKTYNDILSEELIKTGLVALPRQIGLLNIILFPNNKPTIDWNESNKFKQRLIDEGVTVRNGNNGGENWLIRSSDDYRFKICFARGNNLATSKSRFYVFSPTNYTNGVYRTYDFLKSLTLDICFDVRFGLIQKIRNYRLIDPTVDIVYSYITKNK